MYVIFFFGLHQIHPYLRRANAKIATTKHHEKSLILHVFDHKIICFYKISMIQNHVWCFYVIHMQTNFSTNILPLCPTKITNCTQNDGLSFSVLITLFCIKLAFLLLCFCLKPIPFCHDCLICPLQEKQLQGILVKPIHCKPISKHE